MDAKLFETARNDKTHLSVADAVFDFLRRQGIDRVFGNPGSTELPMFVNLPADFSYVLGLQESIVVAMADGYAQVSGKAAFLNLHSAAGLGHALGNIYTAFRNKTPLIITTGQQARSLLPHDPFLFAERATEFPQPYVKWACEPARPEDVPKAIARAYYMAIQPPRGPVMISVPVSDWQARAEEALPHRRIETAFSAPAAALDRLGGSLSGARQPVLVVGPGVDVDGAWAETISLAERLQAPVWASPLSSRCGFPERHHLFAGFLPARQPALSDCLAPADVVLVLGAPAFTYHFQGSGSHLPGGAELWLVSDDPAQIASAVAGNGILSNIRLAAEGLVYRARQRTTDPAGPARKLASAKTASGITPAYLYQSLAELRSPESIVFEEAPSARDALHDHFPIDRPGGFFATASGGLGYGLAGAIGAAITCPEEPVIALIGDGSSLYGIQALWSAVEYEVNLFVVILNNGGYGALRSIGGPSNRIDGVTIGHMDFVMMAEAQGCTARRCHKASELDACLRDMLDRKGPRLLEVILSVEE